MRDLKVWFALRKGLLRELLGGKPLWVRAVDGVSFDVDRGEIFCLVGESGCGKTTTGKAILKLVEATEGDIFLEMPRGEYERYEEARRRGGDAISELEVHRLRSKYSVTWKERRPWTDRQIATLLGVVLGAALVAMILPAAALGFLTEPFTDPGASVGFSLLLGFLLGLVSSLPPTRLSRRTPAMLAALAIPTLVLAAVPTFIFHALAGATAGPQDVPSMIAAPWERDLFGMLVATAFAPMAAALASAVVIDTRQRTSAYAGIRMRDVRKRLQLIFQDPYESLNPKQSVYEIVAEPLQVNRITSSPEETSALVVGALRDAGLRPPEEFMFRFPHELSGGQRQRASVAAALVLQPDFIVADEPVSMLDVSIRTEILRLMLELRRTRGLTYLFITHDLSLAWVIADRVAVMYLGRIVELGTAEQVIAHPKHPYTQALLTVVPSPDPRRIMKRIILKGERPDPSNIPAGCRFHPRCPVAFEKCGWTAQEVLEDLRELAAGDPEAARYLSGSTVNDVRSFLLRGPADAIVAWLRRLKEMRAQEIRSLTAIQEIQPGPDIVRVQLHSWSEPELVTVAPGNEVACFLVEPGRRATVSMEGPPAPVPASS